MDKQNSFNNTFNPLRVKPLVRLWLLRLLVPMGMARECFVKRREYHGVDKDYVNTLAELFDTGKWKPAKISGGLNFQNVLRVKALLLLRLMTFWK